MLKELRAAFIIRVSLSLPRVWDPTLSTAQFGHGLRLKRGIVGHVGNCPAANTNQVCIRRVRLGALRRRSSRPAWRRLPSPEDHLSEEVHMTFYRIDRLGWQAFFSAFTRGLIGKRAGIDVASRDLGDQVLAEWLAAGDLLRSRVRPSDDRARQRGSSDPVALPNPCPLCDWFGDCPAYRRWG